MKSSALPFLPILPAAIAAWFAQAVPAHAQDVLILTNGQRREGKIVEVTGGRVNFQAGPATAAIPLDQIASAKMEPPKAFLDAVEQARVGDTRQALATLKPLVEKFRGLPAAWTERAAAMLATLLLDAGDVPGAEAALAEFQKAYPQSQSLAELSLARLALAKKDLATAEAKARPLAEEARKTLLAPSGKNAQYGQALFVMGRVHEERGSLPEALEHYLLAATIFSEDASTAAQAQARATTLIEEKKVAVP